MRPESHSLLMLARWVADRGYRGRGLRWVCHTAPKRRRGDVAALRSCRSLDRIGAPGGELLRREEQPERKV